MWVEVLVVGGWVWLGETAVTGGDNGGDSDVGCWVSRVSATGDIDGRFVVLDKSKLTPNRLTPGRIRSSP